MELDEGISQKIHELQHLEQNIQILISQKQSSQIEFNECENAFNEVKNSKDDIFKVLSGIMIKADKDSILTELEEKKNVLSLRIKSFEKQESSLDEKISKLRAEITSSVGKSAKK